MTSLSLPRVLQPRKTSLEIEREQFEKAQSVAIHKAVSKEECPVKQKHVRSAIIGTFSHQGAQVFWSIASRLSFMDDVIVAWKFCHVLHKVLREGHPLCIDHSQKHKPLLEDIGKLWGHLTDGYGKLIRQYTALLIAKLDFHRRNPRFPGNLSVTTEELYSICAKNPDICFELSVEIFDYLDAILDLQQTIFGLKASSMTMQGQCRLAPIIPCLQDASRLYDHNVKILFILHTIVDYDLLEGHRVRFLKQFKMLQKFYQNTNTMHYFRNLITVAPLPQNPPNFKANVNTYVTQEVIVPQEIEEEPTEANLIDTSVEQNNSVDHVDNYALKNAPPLQPQIDNFDLIVERDNIIKSLREDCGKLKSEIGFLYNKSRQEQGALKEQISNLETKLVEKDLELKQERQNIQSVLNGQEDEKVKEEKFKIRYFKIRDDHADLLREKAKIDKCFKATEKSLEESESKKRELEEKLTSAETNLKTLEGELNAAQKAKLKLDEIKGDNGVYQMEIEMLKKNIENEYVEKKKLTEEIQKAQSEIEQITQKCNELSQNLSVKNEEIQTVRAEMDSRIENLIKACMEDNITTLKHYVEEIDNPAISALICSPDYLHSLTDACKESLAKANTISRNDPIKVLEIGNRIAHLHSVYILQGRATSNTCPDISFGEKMAESCKTLGKSTIALMETISDNGDCSENVTICMTDLENVHRLAEEINTHVRGDSTVNLEGMLEVEMQAMDKAIEEAAQRMEEMLNKSRKADSGIKLEVNERILDTCTGLMAAIRVLVQKSRLLQGEIVAQGKGTASSKEFYKRNHTWTDGFISAAKSVGVSAKFLLSVADKAVTADGKLEPLIVAAQGISASTAQLVVASRVKAERNSDNLKQLSKASKSVTEATGAIVATVKDCSKLIDESTDIDTSNLTLHQAKRFEMDSQVRVLELEKELEQERLRLAQLRRHHYQLEGDPEK